MKNPNQSRLAKNPDHSHNAKTLVDAVTVQVDLRAQIIAEGDYTERLRGLHEAVWSIG